MFSKAPVEQPLPSSRIITERFIRLFHEHNVAIGQIPLLRPELKLGDLASHETLLSALSNDLLEKTAEQFWVQKEWLEGADVEIYPHRSFYKWPKKFFEDLSRLKFDRYECPVRVLVVNRKLDRNDPVTQPLLLLMMEKITDLGEEIISRYHIYNDGWDWAHSPCRLELKAIARLLYQRLGVITPLIEVPADILEKIERAEAIPTRWLHSPVVTDPSLEDYGSSKDEFVRAREVDELPKVMEYIREHKLDELVAKLWPNVDTESGHRKKEDQAPKPDQQERSRYAAKVRHSGPNQIKRRFIDQYLERAKLGPIPRSQAAKEFYDRLSDDEVKLLCRSLKDYEKKSPDELRFAVSNTLERALREYFKQQQA